MNINRAFGIYIAFVLVVSTLTGCSKQLGSTENGLPFIPKADEQYYGVWLNDLSIHHQKLIYYHWGLVEVYGRVEDRQPEDRGTYAIFRKWKDMQGDTWYASVEKYERYSAGVVCYCLTKISGNGSKYEQVSEVFAMPKEGDLKPNNSAYGEWHRKQ